MSTLLRSLQAEDVQLIASAFSDLGWNKPAVQYECYLAEQDVGKRDILVVFVNSSFAGYLTIVWESKYSPFAEREIPEIVDLNVLPRFRRHGLATALLDAAEERISALSKVVGIGVGMDLDYGAAQRLYVLRGYIPDGRGLSVRGKPVRHGDTVTVDDDLVLYLTKRLRGDHDAA